MDTFSPTNGSEGRKTSSKETQNSRVWGQSPEDILQDGEIGLHSAADDSQVNMKTSPVSSEKTSFDYSSVSDHSLCWRLWPLMLAAVVCLVLFALFRDRSGLWKWLENLPWYWSLLVFILLFTMVSFPFGFGYVILNMMCGYLYGFVRGELTVIMAVSIGFSIAFLLCRNLFKDYARSVVTSSSSTLCAILQVIDGPNGFKVIFLTRLTPIPFGLQTVLFAVSSYITYIMFLVPPGHRRSDMVDHDPIID